MFTVKDAESGRGNASNSHIKKSCRSQKSYKSQFGQLKKPEASSQ